MDRTGDFDLMKHNLTDVIEFTKIIIDYDGFNSTTEFWQPLVVKYFEIIDLSIEEFRAKKQLQRDIKRFIEINELVKWIYVANNQAMLQINSQLSAPQRAFINQLLLLTYFDTDHPRGKFKH